MPKAYVAVLTDGSLLPCSDRDLLSRSSQIGARLGNGPISHMRCGRYALALGDTEVAVMRVYSDEDLSNLLAQRGIYVVRRADRAAFIRDRRSQLRSMRLAFGRAARKHGCEHPNRGLVEHDMRLELETF